MHVDDARKEEMVQRLMRLEAGFAGELRSDHFLEKAVFKGPVRIFTNVELQITPFNFIQIDTIVMTPSFICILEIKNIKGELRFMSNPPCLHRTLNTGEGMVIDCPVYQLEKNITDFDLWLQMNGFQLKSTGALVLAFTSSIVKVPPTTMPIFYAKDLPQFLRKKESDPPIMSKDEFEKVTRRLSNESHPYNPIPLCNYFKIDPTTLINGVFCHVCKQKMLRRSSRTWQCSCGIENQQNPYMQNIIDWFVLIGDSITVEQCRRFLELKNNDAAKYVLKSFNLEVRGKSVSTTYHLPPNFKTPQF